jgi:hypothetical protein
MERDFIVLWAGLSLVWVEDITSRDAKAMWATLKDEPFSTLSKEFRAAMTQAGSSMYQIYSITAESGTTAKDITTMFINNPMASIIAIEKYGNNVNPNEKMICV